MREIKLSRKFILGGVIFFLYSLAFFGLSTNNVVANIEINTDYTNLAPSDTLELEYSEAPTARQVTQADVPEGTSYLLHEHYGGFWADAEKEPDDDGSGNPPGTPIQPDTPGDEDDLLCWAATGSNMMEWTGWGFIGGMEHGNTDDFFDFFINHVTDFGHFINDGIDWWFDGTLRNQASCAIEDVNHVGFWANYTPSTYIFNDWSDPDTLPNIRNQIMSGRPVGLTIYEIGGPGAHAVTCWGFNYNATVNPATNMEDYYLGVWLTDSDNSKGTFTPDDILRYYAVEFDSVNNWWYMPSYGGGWNISCVTSLQVFPGANRPTANIANTVGNEGATITFNAGSSSDPDGDSLEYRWDFNADGTWDTVWSASSTATRSWNDDYSGTVYLEVFDGRLRDIDTATITVNNVAPTISSFNGDVIDEDSIATVSCTFTDPSSADTFTIVIDWGDGSSQTFTCGAGTTSFSRNHQYLDDDPSGTPYDDYSISVSITDDDGGSDTASTTVTVNNVAPTILNLNGDIIDENGVAVVSGTFNDVGTLDSFTITIDWGEGSPQTYLYAAGTTSFSETHQYLDDNPSGTTSDTYLINVTINDDDGGLISTTTTIIVNNVAPVINIDDIEQINSFDLDENIIIMLEPATFTGSASDIGTDDLRFTWDWGDGTAVTSTTYLYSTSPVDVIDIQEHAYTEPGEYIITLTVEDDDLGISQETITVQVLGPRDLKEMAISELETLKTGEFCSDVHVNYMIMKLEKSLCDWYWEDTIHLDPIHGTSVFCNEILAVQCMEREISHNLKMISKYENIIACLGKKGYNATYYENKIAEMLEENGIYEIIMLKFIKADELLARIALNEAENTPIKNAKYQEKVECEISKASTHILLAGTSIENDQYSDAIYHYKCSWEHSQSAIKWTMREPCKWL